MKILLTQIITLVVFAVISACGATNIGNDSGDTATEESQGNQDNWSSEENEMFTNDGENSLGVETKDYDYAIVIGNPGMNLVDEDDTTEDGESDEEESQDESEETDADEEADDDADADDEEEIETPDADELAKCSEHFGTEVEGLAISGSESHTDVDSGEYIAVKLSGNQNSINILLTGEEGAEDLLVVKGICIILRGNQPMANVVVNGVTVESVYYDASGNGASANFEVKDGSSLDAFEGRLGGNAGTLVVTGDGDYSCDSLTVKGNATEPVCGADAEIPEAPEADADSDEETEEELAKEKAKKPDPK